MKNLDWSNLYFFTAVARHGTLAKAAQALGVTHSTVFRRINALEEDLDVRLFDRLPEGYRLTSLGHELVTYAEQISAKIEELQRVLENRNEELKGPINVTAPHNFAYRFLPPLIARFVAQHPDISINLMASNADYNLSRREADLAIRATSAPPDHLVGHKLFSLGWSAFATADYLARMGTPDDMTLWQQHSIILATKELAHLPIFQWADRQADSAHVVARCNDLMSMSSLAVAGVGVALLPDDQAKPELVRIMALDASHRSHIWLLMHPDLRSCSRLILFKNFIQQSLQEDPFFIANAMAVD